MTDLLKTRIQTFEPFTQAERQRKRDLLHVLAEYDEKITHREHPQHLVVASMIMEPSLKETLLVEHHIYQSFSWTGGHLKPGEDPLAAAVREAKEETGVQTIWPMSGEVLAIEQLPVPEHNKDGKKVKAHTHYCIVYGLFAPKGQAMAPKAGENSAVAWFAAEELPAVCKEAHMPRLYQKVIGRMEKAQKKKQACYGELPPRILPWYEKNARDLPWRKDKEPYPVWISEIMLQQTRVEMVRFYYKRFLDSFPTVQALAQGEEEKLWKLWEGLGYYNRARNLQKTAKLIVEEYNGQFPRTYDALLTLPGIGPYTAGAIASICFEQATPAVDGNVLRVAARLTEQFQPVETPAVKKEMTDLLAVVYPVGHCGAFTQGLMELGATVCLPNGAPKCEICPVQGLCLARRNHTVSLLPVKVKKKPRRLEEKTVYILTCGTLTAIQKRTEKGVLTGLWELPNRPGKQTPQEAAETVLQWGLSGVSIVREVYKTHIFTHIEWDMVGYCFTCEKPEGSFEWKTEEQLAHETMLPTAFRQFL